MTICAPNPFGCCGGSRLLKGGYSYWPLWWYGQRDELPDMSGHGVTLYPSGAYFDGQGYYFDGSNDYLIDDDSRKVLQDGTMGSWHSVYLTEGAVPAKGSIWGTGTILYLNISGVAPKITGKIVLRPEYCPNLTRLYCYNNDISVLDVSRVTSLTHLACFNNDISVLDVSKLTSLIWLRCDWNNISVLDVSNLTSLFMLYCQGNNISVLDVSALTLLEYLYCYSNNISVLDVSALTNLGNLRCYGNNISLLDVSVLTNLSTLLCQNNSMDQDMVDTVL
ncbi:MAG TPA: leucine-rich repeat domain-containing protein, partial [Desulfobacteraceae bacterium]|nr:leucine-rich repeat domain-containing protein [Desulfobacteraceae bacterium]